MEPVLMVLLPGVLGGIALALAMPWLWRSPRPYREPSPAPTSPAMINMARIRIEGPGGLGLVAMAAAVAIAQPGIRAAITLGLLFGVPLGLFLIALRRRNGPLTSSHELGAHTMLPLER